MPAPTVGPHAITGSAGTFSPVTDSPTNEPFHVVSRRLLADGGRIHLDQWGIEGPAGTHQRSILVHPGAVAVAPVRAGPTGLAALLVYQWRAPLEAWVWEFPAGTRDVPGEDPVVTGARELREEAGLAADHIEVVGTLHPEPGYTTEAIILMVASSLHEVEREPHGAEEFEMTQTWVSLSDLEGWVADGTVTDAKTVALIYALSRQSDLTAS